MNEILVHIREHEVHTPAACYAARLAAAQGASLTGVFVVPDYLGATLEPELLAELMGETRRAVEAAVAAKASFLDMATSLGAGAADWVVAEGRADEALAQASLCHDLLVLDHAREDSGRISDLPGIVLRAGTPCLVLPRGEYHWHPVERVAIGWNGSPEAVRAVHAALPFLRDRQVLLVLGEERAAYPGLVWHPPFDIAAYLRGHGAAVEVRRTEAKADAVGNALLEEARRFRAGMLVMGAYGRSRFSEWALGGATRDVLQQADLPLLLRH